MGFWALLILWGGPMALRLAFLALHMHDLDGLWNDYARRGLQFQLARGLDYLTLGVFSAAAVWALWGIDAGTPYRLGLIFIAWLGFFLLERLPAHRFPRTNQPGGLGDAMIVLAVHLLFSILGALVATIIAAIYFWRQG
jgi:hypothetical protein